MKKKKLILVITPIDHIKNVKNLLNKIGNITIYDDPSVNKIKKIIHKFDAVFTNPNKSKVFFDKNIIDKAVRLKVICTASTGTNHIDISYAKKKNIHIISLTKEYKLINKISSTSEHAFALTLASIRNLISSSNSVFNNEWDYTPYIGRQMDHLKIGIIGYGRLGRKYANYSKAFGSKVFFFDPYKKEISKKIKKITSLKKLISVSDILSIHVHLTKKTHHMINKNTLSFLKKNAIIINTSRGDIVNESELVKFLKKNDNVKYYSDVIEKEIFGSSKNLLIKYAKKNKHQVIITPHIGGMTHEAQYLAYTHAVKKLNEFLKKCI